MTRRMRLSRKTLARRGGDKTRLTYLPGLDGLRALAVLAVVIYHADLGWLPGGFLGVEIFFVISGYLITALLLAEWRREGTIDLKSFWLRRARRLLPALWVLIGIVLAFAVLALPDEVAGLRPDVAAALGYVTNWYLILAQKSYFETVGRPSLLQHLWSLAIEEQFYLLWPLFLRFILGRLSPRRALALIVAGAVLSLAWMVWLYVPDSDPSRVYYGTDTRAAGLLFGAALAFLWTPWGDAKQAARVKPWLADIVGVLALGALVAACWFIGEFDPFLYRGGLAFVALATVVVIAAVVHPGAQLGTTILGLAPLRWIGLGSYSIYLWHWPIFMVTRPQLDVPLDGAALFALRLSATFLLAAFSYRFVETPIRRGGLERAWQSLRAAQGRQKKVLARQWALRVSALAIFLWLIGGSVLRAQPPATPTYLVNGILDGSEPAEMFTAVDESANATLSDVADESVMSEEEADDVATNEQLFASTASQIPLESTEIALGHATSIEPATSTVDGWVIAHELRQRADRQTQHNRASLLRPVWLQPAPSKGAASQNIAIPRSERNATAVAAVAASAHPTPPVASMNKSIPSSPPPSPARVVLIGDSVMLGASRALHERIPDGIVDAALGRQVSAALKILSERRARGALGKVVVVHMGNNGTFTAKQFDLMMELLTAVPRVILLNNKVPRKWEEFNNRTLAEGAQRYANVVLVDWKAFSADHPEWFWKDGLHLRPEGAAIYADLIASYIQAPITQEKGDR